MQKNREKEQYQGSILVPKHEWWNDVSEHEHQASVLQICPDKYTLSVLTKEDNLLVQDTTEQDSSFMMLQNLLSSYLSVKAQQKLSKDRAGGWNMGQCFKNSVLAPCKRDKEYGADCVQGNHCSKGVNRIYVWKVKYVAINMSLYIPL